MSGLDPRPVNTGLRLDKANGKLMGVCAGLANRFEVDAIWMRLLFVTGTLVGFGSFILIYLLIALLAK
ncbi:PspC domain-containing protein [Croceibacterium sp. TMG7-5b_MA50]|uniref:PspC domain-containing protein n=1 Tax=Croceibacterium sp. TMG7-5b_MA50 TaxID=3121290 RepID=UPI003222197B